MKRRVTLSIGIASMIFVGLLLVPHIPEERADVVGNVVKTPPLAFAEPPNAPFPPLPNIASSPSKPGPASVAYTDNSLVVAFENSVPAKELERAISQIGGKITHHYRAPGLVAVTVPAGIDAEDFAAKIEELPAVRRVERDIIFTLASRPNDGNFPQQWALENTGQEGGTRGEDIGITGSWTELARSFDGVIAVIDSGVSLSHPDLRTNLWVNPGEIPDNGIDDDNNGYVDDVHGIDQIQFDGTPDDPATFEGGHGTAVSGVIGAKGNNALGISGVLWTTKMLTCKVFSDLGYTSLSRILACLDYVAWSKSSGAANVVVVNASWGSYDFSWSLYDAIEALGELDILFVASAGNDGVDIDQYTITPAGFDLDNIISVAATDRHGELAAFSNYGAVGVDLAAPGVDILTTQVLPYYGTISGTSFSAPHVAGVVGLIHAADPSLSGSEIRTFLLESARPNHRLAGKVATGGGLQGTIPLVDSDGDGMSDRWELRYSLDPNSPSDGADDSDGDGLLNLDEFLAKTDPEEADTDSDGVSDGAEVHIHDTDPLEDDTDFDGLTDGTEINETGSDPLQADTDGDGLSDSFEVNESGTNPNQVDTDGDGLSDSFELDFGYDPIVADDASLDADQDGLDLSAESLAMTDPTNADTDHDGLSDGEEVLTYRTSPLLSDTDGDRMDDGWEISGALNPLQADAPASDADQDGYSSLEEYFAKTLPLDSTDTPDWSSWTHNNANWNFLPDAHTAERPNLLWRARFQTFMTPMISQHVTIKVASIRLPESYVLLLGIDTNTGEEIWRKTLHGFHTIESMIHDGTHAYILESPHGTADHQIGKYLLATGEQVGSPLPLDGRPLDDMLIENDELIIVLEQAVIRADVSTMTETSRIATDSAFGTRAYIANDLLVLTSSYDVITFDLMTGEQISTFSVGDFCFLAPDGAVLGPEDDIYIRCVGKHVRADLRSGEAIWEVNGFFSGVDGALDDQAYYAVAFDEIVALDPKTGAQIWRFEVETSLNGSLALTLDTLFFSTVANNFALRLSDRSVIWEREGGGNVTLASDGLVAIDGNRFFDFEVWNFRGDADADGLPDWWENRYYGGRVTPNDGAGDIDDDGLDDLAEFQGDTRPDLADTDGDGLADGMEVLVLNTSPVLADTDGDGLDDRFETDESGTSPLEADSDLDGFNDGSEVLEFQSDPMDPADRPRGLDFFGTSFEDGQPNPFVVINDGAALVVSRIDATDGRIAMRGITDEEHRVELRWQDEFASGELSFNVKNIGASTLRVLLDGAVVAYVSSSQWEHVRIAIPEGSRTIDLEYSEHSAPDDAMLLIDSVRFEIPPPFGARANTVIGISNRSLLEISHNGDVLGAPIRLPGFGDPRDLTFTPDRQIVVSDPPFVHFFDPVRRSLRTVTLEDLSLGRNSSEGGIAASNGGIVVPMSQPTDLLVLNAGGDYLRRTHSDQPYSRIQLGHDGRLYANHYQSNTIDVLDPDTFAKLYSIDISQGDVVSAHATANGTVVALLVGGRLISVDHQGSVLAQSELASDAWTDLTITTAGRVVVTGPDGRFASLALDLSDRRAKRLSEQNIDIRFITSATAMGPDRDGDGLTDWWERAYALDPLTNGDQQLDIDGDGLTNAEEFAHNSDPLNPDTDGDGLTDAEEVNVFGTNPLMRDTDSDGLDDDNEIAVGTHPSLADSDGDGIADGEEIRYAQSNPLSTDSDGDGLDDRIELKWGLDAKNPADALSDPDADGIVTLAELHESGTHPFVHDTDRDGLADGSEITTHATDPLRKDTDNDGMTDGWEVRYALDPLADVDAEVDSDGDGFRNISEFIANSDPTHALGVPISSTQASEQADSQKHAFRALRLDPQVFQEHWQITGLTTDQYATGLLTNNLFVIPVGEYWREAERIIGINLSDGSVQWTSELNGDYLITPIAKNRTGLYALAKDPESGYESRLIRVDAPTGEIQALVNFDFPTGLGSDVLTNGQSLFVTNGRDGGITRINAADGAEVWRYENSSTSTHGHISRHGLHLFTGLSNRLIEIDVATGEPRLEISLADTFQYASTPTTSAFVTSLDALVLQSSLGIRAVDLLRGLSLWTTEIRPVGRMAIGSGRVYVPVQTGIVALDQRTGGTLWFWPSHRFVESRLIATENLVFVATDTLTSAIDAQTGVERWTFPAGGDLSLGNDGGLLIAGEDGTLTRIALLVDEDGDFLPDEWERHHGLDPQDASDAGEDMDDDGLTNAEEYAARTSPTLYDTDSDGLLDFEEHHLLPTNPLNSDSDGDGISDGEELDEWGSRADSSDSDEDGLNDSLEVTALGTDPAQNDSDGDGFPDGFEIRRGSDPLRASGVPEQVHARAANFDGGILPHWLEPSYRAAPWQITSDKSASGTYSIRSSRISAGGKSKLLWEENFADGIIAFRAYSDWDSNPPISVLIDGAEVAAFNLSLGWHWYTFEIVSGYQTLTWQIVGNNEIWIDDIRVLPLDADGDALPSDWELAQGLNPDNANDATSDADSDGLTALEEFSIGTDPNSDDSDADGMMDAWESRFGLDPLSSNAGADSDNDGLKDFDEFALETLPDQSDTDGDGMPDGYEVEFDLDPHTQDSDADPDGDGASNSEEFEAGTNPQDSASVPPTPAPPPTPTPTPTQPPTTDSGGGGGGGGTAGPLWLVGLSTLYVARRRRKLHCNVAGRDGSCLTGISNSTTSSRSIVNPS